MSCGIDLMSRVTSDRVPVPEVLKSSSGGFGPESEILRSQPSVPINSCPATRPQGDDQLSRVTQASVHGPVGSTRCPRRFGPGSEGPQVDQLTWATRAQVRGHTGSTNCHRLLGPLPGTPWCR